MGLAQWSGFINSHHVLFDVTGSFGNPGPYAGFLSSVLPIGLSMYLYSKDKTTNEYMLKYLGLITVILILIILPTSESRASWIACLIGMLCACYPILKNKILNLRKEVAISIVAILLVLGCFFSYILFLWKVDSSMGRVLNWKIAASIFKDHPLIGVGQGNYQHAFGKYQAIFSNLAKGRN